MADEGKPKKDVPKAAYIAAIVAGVIIFLNGIIQLSNGNAGLGVASIVVGAVAVAFGVLKPGRKS